MRVTKFSINFTNRKIEQLSIELNGQIVSYENEFKYLDLVLDEKLS